MVHFELLSITPQTTAEYYYLLYLKTIHQSCFLNYTPPENLCGTL